MVPEERSFGDLLRHFRVVALLTQEQLAERAHLSYRTISDLERGVNQKPRGDTVALLARALDLAPGDRDALIAAAHPSEQQEAAAGPVATTRASVSSSIRTFLIADLRGYSGFTEVRGDEAAATLASAFARIARESVESHGGEIVELRGDEALATFVSARQALRAAIDLQTRLAEHSTREPELTLPTGIGLDAGEAVPVEGGYRGGALNLAARLCSLARAGEVFASVGVVHLAGKTEGLVYVDRGEVRLQGLTRLTQVIQIAAEGAPLEDLPRLQPTLANQLTTMLVQPTSFIGREHELGAVRRLLGREDVRLVTLTGAGGIGKSRLATRAAAGLQEVFPDGICFVSLESVAEPDLLSSAIAAELSLAESHSQSVVERLILHLQNKRFLLILDSFEHLLDCALFVGVLLGSCPQLTILVTSRAILHLAAEHVYEVPTLSLPGPDQSLIAADLSASDAVRLFVSRAEGVEPGFELTDENAPAIAGICARLDGLPLAIELAAARTRMFSPPALLDRLQSRLALLTGGPRDRPRRHQTLRLTIDWSYELLDEARQRLFTRLAVFAGEFTPDAAEAVCADSDAMASTVLEQLAFLADQSLVRTQRDGDAPRLAMLETIREYAQEHLDSSGDAEGIRRRHAEFYRMYADYAASQIAGSRPDIWLTRLEVEFGNLRAALHWAWRAGEIHLGLGLATSLAPFWLGRGHAGEGLTWLDRFLPLDADGKADAGTNGDDQIEIRGLQARARGLAANLANRIGDSKRAQEEAALAVDLYEALGDRWHVARTLRVLAEAEHRGGNLQSALIHYQRSHALHTELGHAWEAAHVWNEMRIAIDPAGGQKTRAELEERWNLLCGIMSTLPTTDPYYPVALGQYAFHLQLYDQAWQLLESGRVIAERAGDKQQLGIALHMLGEIALLRGDLAHAAELLDTAEPMRRDTEDAQGLMYTLRHRAKVAFLQGNLAGAASRYEESLGLLLKLGDRRGVVDLLRNLGDVARVHGDLDRANGHYRDSLRRAQELDDLSRIAAALRGLAGVCAADGDHETAARLFAAASTYEELTALTRLIDHAPDIVRVRDALGEAAFERAWSEGQAVSLQKVSEEYRSD